MNDAEINEFLYEAAQGSHPIDSALVKSIADAIRPSLRPVRRLPAPWTLAIELVLVCAALALAGAARIGLYGIAKMTLPERLLIFSILAALAWVAGTSFVGQMIPGRRRRLFPGALLGAASAALLVLFALLFRDYHTDHFVSAGILCLGTGFLHAIPAALLSWLVLRRGFAVDPVSAGLTAGVLAGLVGVGVLELHCANFQAAHVMVWHTAVMPLSGAVGAFVGWLLQPRTH